MADTKTDNDLFKRVLKELSQVNGESEPDAEDILAVKNVYEPLLETMRENNVAFWETDEIPSAAFLPAARYVAYFAAPEFGIKYDPSEELIREKALRRITQFKYLGDPVKAVYY